MKKIVILLLLALTSNFALCQLNLLKKEVTYPGGAGGNTHYKKVIRLSDGNYLFGGESPIGVVSHDDQDGETTFDGYDLDGIMMKANDSLNPVWNVTNGTWTGLPDPCCFGSFKIDSVVGIAQNNAGDVLMVLWSPDIAFAYTFVSYNLATGSLNYFQAESSPVAVSGIIRDTALDAIIMYGGNTLWKLDMFPSFAIRDWTSENSSGTFKAGITVASNAYLFGGDNGSNSFIMMANSSGNTVWTKEYQASNTITINALYPVSGGYLITGTYNQDVYLQKVDLNGNTVFSTTYALAGSEVPTAITIKGGQIFISGNSGADALLYMLDINGTLLSAKKYSNMHLYDICQNDASANTLTFAGDKGGAALMMRSDLNGNAAGCFEINISPSATTLVITDNLPSYFLSPYQDFQGGYSGDPISSPAVNVATDCIQPGCSTPVASVSASGPTTICTGGSVSLNVGTAAGNSYQWQLNNSDISGETNSSYTAAATGSYTCVVTNTCGTLSSNAISVIVNTVPSANITPAGPTTVCSGTVILNANTGAALSYQWNNNGGAIAGATAASYTATSSGSYTVLVTATGGCSATSAATLVTIAPLTATVNPSGTVAICSGTSTILSANTGIGFTYQWYRNNVLLSGSASTFTTATQGTYKCLVTSGTCTSTSNSVVVSVINNPAATVTYTSPLTFCFPGSITLTANTFSGVTYQWEKNSVAIAGATLQNYTATAAGAYRVKETKSGCSAYSSAKTVATVTSVTAVISTNDPTTLCAGGTVNLSVTSPIPGYGYQWNINGVAIGGATATTYTATTSGNYTVTATASCGTGTSNAITINIGSFAAQITPTGNVTACTGGTLILTANTGSGFTYQWMNGGVNIPGATNPTLNVTASGSYSVFMTSPCGSATSAATVVSLSSVTATVSPAGASSVCSGTSITFAASTGTGYTYKWYRNNVLLSATTPTFTTSTAGSYKVEVSISGTCALFSNTAVLTVINNPTPTIAASGPTTFCAGGSVTFTANTYTGVTYQWQKNSVNIAGATGQTYIATTAGVYRANETANGCSKFTPKKTVIVNCRLASEETIDGANRTELSAYPNPFNDKINIQLNSSDDDAVVTIKVSDVTGRVIAEQIINANRVYTIGENMCSGIYFVTAKQNDTLKTIRVVKNQ